MSQSNHWAQNLRSILRALRCSHMIRSLLASPEMFSPTSWLWIFVFVASHKALCGTALIKHNPVFCLPTLNGGHLLKPGSGSSIARLLILSGYTHPRGPHPQKRITFDKPLFVLTELRRHMHLVSILLIIS